MLLAVLEPDDVEDVGAGFAFVANQNYILHKAELGPRYDALVDELKAVCADGDRLRAFWESARAEAERDGRLAKGGREGSQEEVPSA